MTKKADDKRGALDSLRLDLAETADEVWNNHPATNLDDDDPSAAHPQHDARDTPAMSAARPQRATKLRTREEIFEHRMAVMAHRRAQLDAHRNRQARRWFALTGALLFVGASGLGAFYYRTADDWKFLSVYSLDTPAYQSVQTASAAAGSDVLDGSASSHFQSTEALAVSPPVEPQQQSVEEITSAAVIEVPRLPEVEIESAAEPLREPVAPVQATPEQADLAQAVAEPEPAAKPAPNFVKPETKRFVRVAPTAMPAPPKTVYNLNKTQSTEATSELIMVPVEPAQQQPNQKVASLSPKVIAPKTNSTTGSDANDAAIENALSVPPQSMELNRSELDGNNGTDEQAASPLPSQNGKKISILLERGDKLLLLGDIVSARQLYQHAFQQGDQLAAARIGSTYDPRIFAQLGVQGLRPDSKLALKWYNRAADAGDERAKQTARSLSRQLSQP
ncbi:MAG: hypothetical protein AAGA00_08625 [Pseudomonadota bacterium]